MQVGVKHQGIGVISGEVQVGMVSVFTVQVFGVVAQLQVGGHGFVIVVGVVVVGLGVG